MKSLAISACVLFGTVILAVPARADLYGFSHTTADNMVNVHTGESQLYMSISSVSRQPGRLAITFMNVGSEASSVSDIYFSFARTGAGGIPSFGTLASMTSSSGVSFSRMGSTNLFNSGGMGPGYVTALGFSASSDPSVITNGIDPGESLGLTFALRPGMSADDVLAALQDGSLRIGLGVRGFSDGGGESFINAPAPVPAASSTFLAMTGLALLGLRRKRS